MSIFKAYDIRGIYPAELNEEVAYKVGRALVKFLEAEERRTPTKVGVDAETRRKEALSIVVGRDHRLSSPALSQAVMQGILDEGGQVVDIGMVSTPMFNFAVAAYPKHDGGVMITASHNPKEYNGLKLCTAGARPVGKESGMGEIERGVAEVRSQKLEVRSIIQNLKIKKLDVLSAYVEKILSLVPLTPAYAKASAGRPTLSDKGRGGTRKYKIVVDAGNSVGALSMTELFNRLPNTELVPLYFDLDATFPHHEANPLKTETLKDLQCRVIKEKADFGLALDGDGDRVGFVDEK